MQQRPVPETLLRQHVNAVSRRLAGARAGDVQAIHRARVATRRLREGLPLLTSGAGRRQLERAVRRLTRALGPVRELDVSLELLHELENKGHGTPAALECVRQSIAGERRVAHVRAVKQIGRWDGPRMQKKARSAVRALPEAADLRVRRSARRAAARRRAARRAERLRAAIERAAGIYLPDRLHDVRVAAKKLRYALEMVRQVSGARPPGATRPRSLRSLGGQLALLEQTQDLLGRMHDLDVLITRTRGVQSGSKVPDLRLSAELDDLVRWLETECRQLHGHYMTSRVRLLEACTRIARAAARAPRRSAA